MTLQLPSVPPALNECRRTLAERRARQAKKPQPEGIARIMAMEQAVRILEIAERITYYEQSDPPKPEKP